MLFVTTDGSKWGAGEGRVLNPDEIDGNFWEAVSRLAALEAAGVGIGLARVEASGNVLTFVLTDHTEYEVTIPFAYPNQRGTWTPGMVLAAMDFFSYNGVAYITLYPHTAAGSFDPDANDGLGHDYYGVLLEVPSNIIPTGGDTGDILAKNSATNFDIGWLTPSLRMLDDISLDSSPIEGDILQFDGSNFVNRPLTLPVPASGTGGGVEVFPPVPGEFVVGLGGDGILITAVVTFDDISGTLDFADLDGEVDVDQLQERLVQAKSSSGGVLAVNLTLGRYITCTLTENITSITFTNWPASGRHAVAVFEFYNPASYTVTGWTASGSVKWSNGGAEPTPTPGGVDRYLVSTRDAGANLLNDIVGQEYETP